MSVFGNTFGRNYTSYPPGQEEIIVYAPDISAENVSTFDDNSATLSFTVSPNNGETSISVQWGLTTAYSGTPITPTESPISTTTSISVDLSTLTSDTLYHWRVVATNSAGTTTGVDNTFTTSLAPSANAPILTNYSITPLPDRYYRVSVDVDPNGADSDIYLNYGRNTDTKIAVNMGLVSVGFPITLTYDIPNPFIDTWYWNIVGTNSYGETATDNDTLVITTQEAWRTTDSTGDKEWPHIDGQTFYIDPTVATSGNGSITSPWKTWGDIVWNANRQYLWRRGTTDLRGAFARNATLTNVVFGAYGSGDRPKLLSNSVSTTRPKIFDLGQLCDNVIISGLEIGHATSNSTMATVINCPNLGAGAGVYVEDCYLHSAIWGVRVERKTAEHQNLTLRNVVIRDIRDDAVYLNHLNNCRIENCYIHEFNQNWFAGATEGQAAGDGIQFIGVRNNIVIGTKIDKHDTANKFCVIHQQSQNPIFANSENSEHIHCEYIAHLNPDYTVPPAPTGDVCAIYVESLSIDAVGTTALRQHIKLTNCKIIGNSSNPESSVWGMMVTRCTVVLEDNIYENIPLGIQNRESGIITSHDDTWTNVPQIYTPYPAGLTIIT